MSYTPESLNFLKSILQQQIFPSDKDDDLKAFFIFIFTTLIIYIDIVNKKNGPLCLCWA